MDLPSRLFIIFKLGYRQLISKTWRDQYPLNGIFGFRRRKFEYVDRHGVWMRKAIQREQLDYVLRMELEQGTALNGA